VTSTDPQDVKAFIVSSLQARLGPGVVHAQALTDDFDLRGHGVIDSLGFVQLLGELEAHFRCAISFDDVSPERLTIVGVLCRHVAAQVSSASPVVIGGGGSVCAR
jgi:acyl carrier protein